MTSIVTAGFGLPQAPFVTRALGKAITQAFPTKSGVNRLWLYELQEKEFEKDKEKLEKKNREKTKKIAKKKDKIKISKTEIVKKEIIEEDVDEEDIDEEDSSNDFILPPISKKGAEEEIPYLDISFFSLSIFTSILSVPVVIKEESRNDDEEAIVLLLAA